MINENSECWKRGNHEELALEYSPSSFGKVFICRGCGYQEEVDYLCSDLDIGIQRYRIHKDFRNLVIEETLREEKAIENRKTRGKRINQAQSKARLFKRKFGKGRSL